MVIKLGFIMLLLGVFSCTKNETFSLVGKWYYASKDTKNQVGSSCDLKDTTISYTRTTTSIIYEFKSDNTYTVTDGSSLFKGQGTYTYSNNSLTLTTFGTTNPSVEVSNISSEGWRLLQKNYIWCPSKTAFNEYLNYKKY